MLFSVRTQKMHVFLGFIVKSTDSHLRAPVLHIFDLNVTPDALSALGPFVSLRFHAALLVAWCTPHHLQIRDVHG